MSTIPDDGKESFDAYLRHHLWTGIFQLAQKYVTVSEFLTKTKKKQRFVEPLGFQEKMLNILFIIYSGDIWSVYPEHASLELPPQYF